LNRNLVFAVQMEARRGNLTPEGEALWVGHRLTQLISLCTEPGLVQCHSLEIQNFWINIIRELFEKPRSVESV
jgi:hypothetical protein